MSSRAASSKPRLVRCPGCGGDSVYSPQNSWRPFCSERCRQVDLGAWASEAFRVEVNPEPDEADELSDSAGHAHPGFN